MTSAARPCTHNGSTSSVRATAPQTRRQWSGTGCPGRQSRVGPKAGRDHPMVRTTATAHSTDTSTPMARRGRVPSKADLRGAAESVRMIAAKKKGLQDDAPPMAFAGTFRAARGYRRELLRRVPPPQTTTRPPTGAPAVAGSRARLDRRLVAVAGDAGQDPGYVRDTPGVRGVSHRSPLLPGDRFQTGALGHWLSDGEAAWAPVVAPGNDRPTVRSHVRRRPEGGPPVPGGVARQGARRSGSYAARGRRRRPW